MVEISVVIPTYNRKEMLKDCLASLFNQDFDKDNYEIIVVDDGSSDGTEKLIQNLIKTAPIPLHYQWQKNIGAPAARNNGFKKSAGEIIAFIDDDCVVSKNWLLTISKTFSENPEVSACAWPVKIHPSDIIKRDEKGFFSDPLSPSCPGTGNFAIKSEIFAKAGGFNNDLYPNEDNDFFIRLLKFGYKIYINEQMLVNHKSITQPMDIFIKNFRYGVADPAVFKKNFPGRFVFRFDTIPVLNNKFFYTVYIKLDFFNVFFVSIFFLPIFPLVTAACFSIVTGYFIYLCAKTQCLTFKNLLDMYPVYFGRIIGNIIGSFKNGIIFYGP